MIKQIQIDVITDALTIFDATVILYTDISYICKIKFLILYPKAVILFHSQGFMTT